MRVEFSSWIEAFGAREPRLIFITGDLGYGALENVRSRLGPRFVNAGVSEQNMISIAAALAQQGLLPLCYSIAPFAIFRPFEQIRLDVALHHHPVKIVGNGGGYGYGIMGASHHAIEDLAVMSCLQGMKCVVPLCGADVAGACEAAFDHNGPAYLRLGLGRWPDEAGPLARFGAVRPLVAVGRPKLTIVGTGPVLLPAIVPAVRNGRTDVFAVSEIPLLNVPDRLKESVAASQRLLVIEEHVARGGLGEHIAALLVRDGIGFKLHHCHAAGYPGGRYGSQKWHLAQSGLDAAALEATVQTLSA
jgi:transketolase